MNLHDARILSAQMEGYRYRIRLDSHDAYDSDIRQIDLFGATVLTPDAYPTGKWWMYEAIHRDDCGSILTIHLQSDEGEEHVFAVRYKSMEIKRGSV